MFDPYDDVYSVLMGVFIVNERANCIREIW